MPPVEVALNKDGTRWVAELRGHPDTRAYARTLGEASERARRIATVLQETGRFKSSSSTVVA
jgi:hypothetical protein